MSITGEQTRAEINAQMEKLATGTGALVQPAQGQRANFFDQTDTIQLIANNGFRSQ
jgi:hypothetical protein